MAIQLAKAVGATVAVTAGTADKLEACRALGADVLVNYRDEDFVERVKEATGGRGANVVLDNMGAKYLGRNVDVLATNGRLVVIGMQGGRVGELDLGVLLAKRGAVIATSLRARPLPGEGGHRRRGARARLAARRGRRRAPGRPLPAPAGRGRRSPPRAGGERPHRQDPAHGGVTPHPPVR